MKLKKTPIASAVALALMSVVTPMHAQQSDTKSVDAPKSDAQPGATAAQAAKDKAKADKAKAAAAKLKASGAKDSDAKTAQEEPQANLILAQAPTPPAAAIPPGTAGPVQSLTVTGYRFSLERSLEAKRNADSVVEVVTADDIGKLPDKNIADAVQRVPGVTISSAAGG
jgi:iron complex outermembrane recepter protein